MYNNGEFEEDSKPKQNNSRDYILRVVGLVIGNVLGLTGMFLVADQTEDWNSWANVVAVWVLGLATLNVVIISALTSSEAIETMRHQEAEMTLQRKTAQDQLRAMLEGFEHTTESFAASERAYIGIKTMNFDRQFGVGMVPGYTIRFLNGGRTPAWNMLVSSRVVLVDKDVSAREAIKLFPIPNDGGADKGGFLPSGSERNVFFIPNLEIAEDDFIAIRAGTKKLLVFGSVYYRDFQQNQQILPFANVFNPDDRACGFEECYD